MNSIALRSCKNICVFDDITFMKGNLYLFHKFMDMSMDKFLSRNTPSKRQVRSLTQQLLTGCQALHKQGVMHRNLKPKHLLLQKIPGTDDFHLKICDFALVRVNSFPQRQFSPEVVTIWYRCPEILMGEKAYTTAIDLWSVGCIVCEMLKGGPLFCGRTEIEQLFKIFQLLGTPTFKGFESYINFSNFKFPNWQKNTFVQMYSKGAKTNATGKRKRDDDRPMTPTSPSPNSTWTSETELLFDLIDSLLECDPSQRTSAREALTHPYFTGSTPSLEAEVFDDPYQKTQIDYCDYIFSMETDMLNRQTSAELNSYGIDEHRPHILSSHRAILIDWLVEVGDVFSISTRTIFLAVNLFDRFIEAVKGAVTKDYQVS